MGGLWVRDPWVCAPELGCGAVEGGRDLDECVVVARIRAVTLAYSRVSVAVASLLWHAVMGSPVDGYLCRNLLFCKSLHREMAK